MYSCRGIYRGLSTFSHCCCALRCASLPVSPSLRRISNITTTFDIHERFKNVERSMSLDPTNHTDESAPYFDHGSELEDNEKRVDVKSSEDKVDLELLKKYSSDSLEDALMHFIPNHIKLNSRDEHRDEDYMTPGLSFFLENKDALINNIKEIYERRQMPLNENLSEMLNEDVIEESYGSYSNEYIVQRSKDHLWDYDTTGISRPKKMIELTHGVMPTIQQVIDILEQECLTDIKSLDLEDCGQRDKGLYVIVATGSTRSHCRRVGRMLYRIIVDLSIPFVSKVSYCCHSRQDEWIIAHLGPLCVHLMIKEVRSKYSLHDIWLETKTRIEDTTECGGYMAIEEEESTHKYPQDSTHSNEDVNLLRLNG